MTAKLAIGLTILDIEEHGKLATEMGTITRKYWVIGATYTDMDFSRCIKGSSDVAGPYGTKEEAHHVWKSRAEATRSQCLTRYVIVKEGA